MASTPWWASNQWLPYVLVAITLPIALHVLLTDPLPWQPMNTVVGGLFLAVTLASTARLIERHSGPGGRGPDF
jgi:VIT1/CCC1 family predicted Fe2+/Mn2+ transporter